MKIEGKLGGEKWVERGNKSKEENKSKIYYIHEVVFMKPYTTYNIGKYANE